MLKISALLITGMLALASFSAQAEFNPFKKPKKISFASDTAWQFRQGVAIKSATRQDGSDTLYYHVRVSRDQLSLRLSKNDASGEVPNSRGLESMEVLDVQLDGRTLPRFQWCLQNQQAGGDRLRAGVQVAGHTCVNPGNGDFFMKLDDATKQALKSAATLGFIIEPYGRPIMLNFSMNGFGGVMARVDQPPPPPPPAARPAPAPKPAAPAVVKRPEPKPKPVAKPKPKPKPKLTICKAEPPREFAGEISALNYPCDDQAQKDKAQASIERQVAAAKQKRAAEEAKRKQQAAELKKAKMETSKAEREFEAQQAALWIKRCQRHWDKGTSPCYCEKYLDHAPAGVNNTCGR